MNIALKNFPVFVLLVAGMSGCGDDPGEPLYGDNDPGKLLYGKWRFDPMQIPEEERSIEELRFVKNSHMFFDKDRAMLHDASGTDGIEKIEAKIVRYRRDGDDIIVDFINPETEMQDKMVFRRVGEGKMHLVKLEFDEEVGQLVLNRVDETQSVTGTYVCADIGFVTHVELTSEGKIYSTANVFGDLQNKAGTYEVDGDRVIATVDGESNVLRYNDGALMSGDGLCVK